MKAPHAGLLVFGGLSLAVMGGAALFFGRLSPARAPTTDRAEQPPGAPSSISPLDFPDGSEGAAQVDLADAEDDVDRRVEALMSRLMKLLGRASDDDDEVGRIENELLSLGERAAGPLVEHLNREKDTARRDRMLDLLRKIPGAAAEAGLIQQARSGAASSSRAIAIGALGDRRTLSAMQALDDIAHTDRQLPSRPLITTPRDPNDPSTELPDEVLFTPRMQAMAALASTEDPRAAPMLGSVLRDGPDESLRMEAARDLQKLRFDPGASEALRIAAGRDPSPYVRLSALHALDGSTDPSLAPVLAGIAARDPDAGVRALAERVLAHLRQ